MDHGAEVAAGAVVLPVQQLSGVAGVERVKASVLAYLARRHLVAAYASAVPLARAAMRSNPARRKARHQARAMAAWCDGTADRPRSLIIRSGDPVATLTDLADVLALGRDVAATDIAANPDSTTAAYFYLQSMAALAAVQAAISDLCSGQAVSAAM